MKTFAEVCLVVVGFALLVGLLIFLQSWRYNQCIQGGLKHGACVAIISR